MVCLIESLGNRLFRRASSGICYCSRLESLNVELFESWSLERSQYNFRGFNSGVYELILD